MCFQTEKTFFCILREDENVNFQEEERMATLSLRNVTKVYPNGFEAVKDFNLDIEDKEFIIFVGP